VNVKSGGRAWAARIRATRRRTASAASSGGKREEVGLCQLDLLIRAISGRLSLASPAFGPDLRLDLVDIVLYRTPRFLYVFTAASGPSWLTVP